MERFNAPGLAPTPGYSHVAVATGGRLVFTAGAVPLDEEGRPVGPGDYAAQTRQVLANLARALEAAGATGDDVLKTTVYVVSEDRSDLAEVWRVVQESDLAAAASTLLGVSLLGYEGQLVEIEAVAERLDATEG
ncbi:RidA family protein [Rubrobacter tropicus]|uniref:RidA family protein n=1 Tax=Rubrobacter tropicus TaxID=2653851 RepID=UPI00389B0A4E